MQVLPLMVHFLELGICQEQKLIQKEIVRLFSLDPKFLVLVFNSDPVELYRNIVSTQNTTLTKTFEWTTTWFTNHYLVGSENIHIGWPPSGPN